MGATQPDYVVLFVMIKVLIVILKRSLVILNKGFVYLFTLLLVIVALIQILGTVVDYRSYDIRINKHLLIFWINVVII